MAVYTIPDLRFYKEAKAGVFHPREDVAQEMADELISEMEAEAASATATATAAAAPTAAEASATATAALVRPKTAKPSSSLSADQKNAHIHADNFIGDTGFVHDHAMMRALLYLVSPKLLELKENGLYAKCRNTAHTLTFISQLANKSNDFDRCQKEAAIVMCPVCLKLGATKEEPIIARNSRGEVILNDDGTPKTVPDVTGNHYVAVVIDSRPPSRNLSRGGGGVIYYWDPKGIPLVNEDIRAALRKRFPTFTIRDAVCHTQNDGEQCAIWTIVYFRQYVEYANAAAKYQASYNNIMLYSLGKYVDFTVVGETPTAVATNRLFIQNARKVCQNKTAVVRASESMDSLLE